MKLPGLKIIVDGKVIYKDWNWLIPPKNFLNVFSNNIEFFKLFIY